MYEKPVKFVRDEPKRLTNLQVHGLDFADAAERFDWERTATAESYASRLIATSYLDGRLVTPVFAPIGSEAVSLISLRPASRKEREAHDQR